MGQAAEHYCLLVGNLRFVSRALHLQGCQVSQNALTLWFPLRLEETDNLSMCFSIAAEWCFIKILITVSRGFKLACMIVIILPLTFWYG